MPAYRGGPNMEGGGYFFLIIFQHSSYQFSLTVLISGMVKLSEIRADDEATAEAKVPFASS